MQLPIIQTKIIPEKSPGGLIKRNKLTEALKNNADKKLIALIASAGFGKTTLIKQFLNNTGADFSWYRIDPDDDTLLKFLTYVIHSVRMVHPDFGETALTLSESLRIITRKSPDTIINSIGSTLINDAVKYPGKDFYIVLDDYHLLPKEEWVKKITLYLAENLPDNFHLILTSREIPAFETGKLKAKRKYFELSSKDMKMSVEELSEIAKDLYELDITEPEAEIINTRIGGWVTGIHLLLQSHPDKTGLLLGDEELPASLYDYFAEDIFASLDEAAKDFLLKTSMLENFTSKICEYILGNKSFEKPLQDLLNRNVFIERSESSYTSEPVYNYTDLFRDFLLIKLNETISGKKKAELLNSYAEYYTLVHEPVKSVKYYLEAQNYEKAIEIILKIINEIGDTGNIDIADKWLHKIPEHISKSNPYLLYYKGCHIKNIDQNFESAAEYFKSAIKLFEKAGDKKFAVRSYTFIAEMLIRGGKTDEALKIINPLLKQELGTESRVNLLYWKAIIYYNLSSYDKAHALLEEALAVEANETLSVRYAILNHLGNIYLIRGDYAKALFYYEIVVKKINNIYNKFETLLNIVQTLANSGNLEKAKETLDQAEDIKYTYPAPFFQINFLLSALELSFSACDYEKAIDISNELLLSSLDRNFNDYILLSYLTIARCYYYLNDIKKANENLKYGTQYLEDRSEADRTDYEFWNTVIGKDLKIRKNMEGKLKEFIKFFMDKDMHYEEAQSSYHLADLYLRSGKTAKAEETLEHSFSLAEENDFSFKFQSYVFINRQVFDFAAQQKIKPGFIRDVFRSAFGLEKLSWLSPDCIQRLKDQTSELYDIKINTFGKTEILVRGKNVPEEAWLRKNRKFIFVYIFLHQKHDLTKDHIVDMFYPDSNLENADNIFYQLMSNIRSVLKIEPGEKYPGLAPVELITYHDKVIDLDPGRYYYADSFEFEDLFRKGFNVTLSREENLRSLVEASQLYKGDFLEGCYEPWCEEMRVSYKNMYRSLLQEIVRIFKEKKEYREVVIYSELLLKTDDLDEEAYVDILDAEQKLNNFPAINQRISKITALYKRELNESPPDKIKAKINKIKPGSF